MQTINKTHCRWVVIVADNQSNAVDQIRQEVSKLLTADHIKSITDAGLPDTYIMCATESAAEIVKRLAIIDACSLASEDKQLFYAELCTDLQGRSARYFNRMRPLLIENMIEEEVELAHADQDGFFFFSSWRAANLISELDQVQSVSVYRVSH